MSKKKKKNYRTTFTVTLITEEAKPKFRDHPGGSGDLISGRSVPYTKDLNSTSGPWQYKPVFQIHIR